MIIKNEGVFDVDVAFVVIVVVVVVVVVVAAVTFFNDVKMIPATTQNIEWSRIYDTIEDGQKKFIFYSLGVFIDILHR